MCIDDFLQVSIRITGFGRLELLSTGMLPVYHEAFVKQVDYEKLKFFWTKIKAILKLADDNDIDKEIARLIDSSSKIREVVNAIIIVWYLGTVEGSLVSAEAYTESLIYAVAHTHPGGSRQPGYGSWAEPPIV